MRGKLVSQITMRMSDGMRTSTWVRLLQSRSSAVPCLPNTEEYWSRIPHMTPASWFSACWQASAISRGPG